MEYLDILDSKGQKTGASAPFGEVHQKGLIHSAAHVWIINPKGELLIQKRAAQKDSYPNHWDISTGGHVSAGETNIEGAKREVKEELGLTLEDSDLIYLFTLEQHIVLNDGKYINNEFNDVYLVRTDKDLKDMTLEDEVAEIKWVTIDELKAMLKDGKELIVPHDEEYKLLFDFLAKSS